MQTFNLTPVAGGVSIVENGGQPYTRPLGYDTLASRGDSVVIEQRPASGGVWGRRIYTTDGLTVGGVLFSGTSAQMLALLQSTFAVGSGNNNGGSGSMTSTASDLEFTDYTKGPILKTSDGTRVKLTAVKDADGTVTLNISDPL